jgi:hypothetical protein
MAKSKPSVIFPWKKACILRKEIRERELKQEDFAVDLFLIVNKPASGGPFYCDPDQFFAITYATENLRKFCSDVLARLAGRADGVSLVNIAQTSAAANTCARHIVLPLRTRAKLPQQHPAVREISQRHKYPLPAACIAAVSFDKVDWKAGGLVKSPDGEARQ